MPSAYEQYKEAASNYENAIDAYLEAAAPIKEFVEYYDSVMQEINARSALGDESACVIKCIGKKLPHIGLGVTISSLFKMALVETGVGAVGVAAFEYVSNSSTMIDIYNAYQECKNEDCICEE